MDEGESRSQALEMAVEERYDIFFLDINLGDIMDDYILKPFDRRRLEKMLKKCGFGKPSP